MNWTTLVQLALQYLPQVLGSGAAPWLGSLLGAAVSYDHNTVKWVQGGLNQVWKLNPPLVVDGIWGPKTAAGVQAVAASYGLQSGSTLSRELILGLEAGLKALPKT